MVKPATNYPVRLPPEIRASASEQAKLRRWSLHTYILAAIEEKLERDCVLPEKEKAQTVAPV